MAKKTYSYDYPRPMVTVDCVLLRVVEGRLEALLVRRKHAPAKDKWALPGGFVGMNEPLEQAVLREVQEETGLEQVSCLTQFGAYGDPKRDPRGRVISIAYIGIIAEGNAADPVAGDDALEAEWHAVEKPPHGMAFDHPTILGDALLRLGVGGRTSGVLFAFLPARFTTEQMAAVLNAVYGMKVDARKYLAPFADAQVVKATKDGKAWKYVGWHKGMRRKNG